MDVDRHYCDTLLKGKPYAETILTGKSVGVVSVVSFERGSTNGQEFPYGLFPE